MKGGVFMNNLSLVALEKTSKAGKTYYGIFAIANDVEVLVCFISKHQYELLNDLTQD